MIITDVTRKITKKLFKPLMPWLETRPFAAQMHEWDELRNKNKELYPIRYRLFNDLPTFIDIKFSRLYNTLISDPIWALKYRLMKRHQYHVLRPKTLRPGYHDPMKRILHGVMEEACEHYANRVEQWGGHPPDMKEPDLDAPEGIEDGWDEADNILREVSIYWNETRDQLKEQAKEASSISAHNAIEKLAKEHGYSNAHSILWNKDFHDHRLVKEWRKGHEKAFKIEAKIKRLDKTNLRKIIRILDYLWD